MNDIVRLSTALPSGWYCKSVSVSGFGVYQKTHRSERLPTRPYVREGDRRYQIVFNGFMGGWVVEELGFGTYLFNGNPFPTYMAAILAVEIELANASS